MLAARLSDARFFWDVDRKKTLAEHAEGLKRITFHEKLGTVADKVERVAMLARWLVEEGIVTDSPLPVGEGPGVGVPTSQASNTHPQPLPSREGASLADMAEQAARLCKADLVTEMVGEFPELQGLMGGYYARAEGLPDAVADAIRDHYKPVGQGDDVPTAPVTVAVSLADKLDTVCAFFLINEKPTGSKDPFALRRAAVSALTLITNSSLRMPAQTAFKNGTHEAFSSALQRVFDPTDNVFLSAIMQSVRQGGGAHIRKSGEKTLMVNDAGETIGTMSPKRAQLLDEFRVLIERFDSAGPEVMDFFADRLKVQQREAGVRHDLIDAVFALGGEDDLVRLLARVHALQSFMETEDGTNLLAGYKRAANILKKEDWQGADDGMPHTGEEDPLVLVDDPDMKDIVAAQMAEREKNLDGKSLSYTPEPGEKALIDALDAAGPQAERAVEEERFADAMSALASLRKPIDDFFENVTVNDDDEAKRTARLGLLARFRDAVHQVADFGKIEG